MKILFITPYVPTNRAGGEKFTKLLLEHLSQNHKVDLLYFRYANDPEYISPNKNVRVLQVYYNSIRTKLCNAILYPIVYPLFSVRFNYSVLRFLKIKMKENEYDLLYLDHSQMALYGKFFPNIRKVYMSHDVMAQRYTRNSNFLIRRFVLASEKYVMHQPNTMIFTFSEKDRLIIKSKYKIDSYVTNFYLDDVILSAIPMSIERQLVFFGQWKRADNFDGLKWFVENVYKGLSKDIRILIIGGGLSEDFQTYVKSLDRIEYLGFVENPYKLIANSLAVVSPLFSGAGVKVKVIESLACGTPVIGNDIAFEGISSEYEDFMFYADSIESYVYTINNINISISQRIQFKEFFLKSYQHRYISSFIDGLNNKMYNKC